MSTSWWRGMVHVSDLWSQTDAIAARSRGYIRRRAANTVRCDSRRNQVHSSAEAKRRSRPADAPTTHAAPCAAGANLLLGATPALSARPRRKASSGALSRPEAGRCHSAGIWPAWGAATARGPPPAPHAPRSPPERDAAAATRQARAKDRAAWPHLARRVWLTRRARLPPCLACCARCCCPAPPPPPPGVAPALAINHLPLAAALTPSHAR